MKTAITTIELRWFYPGTIATEVERWFQEDCPGEKLESPEEREDVYLYLPECEYLGIKLRQEKLEIKWRKAELGVLRFAQGLEGKAERWAKWSCEDPTKESFLPADVVGKPWVSVQKVRSQRRYQDCNVELTHLSVRGDAWWSLGFEAPVEPATPVDNFHLLTTQVLKTYPNSHLQAQDSFAYPSWLSVVVG